MCPDKGLDTLVDAFIELKKIEKLKNAKLRIAGGESSADEKFIESMQNKLGSHGLINDVEFLSSFDRSVKFDFLSSLSILTVPEKKPVAYGLYVLEALASGVPVVEPAIGVFPELLEMTDGGVLYKDNSTTGLVSALEQLLLDPESEQELGKRGRDAIIEKFNIERTAQEMIKIFEQIVS
jgi:glycosyltransferase involved in cell wall biosynthesis